MSTWHSWECGTCGERGFHAPGAQLPVSCPGCGAMPVLVQLRQGDVDVWQEDPDARPYVWDLDETETED